MAKRGPRQGWMKLKNPSKFRLPVDRTMRSYRGGCVLYKSGLELSAFNYCDINPSVAEWSLEPFFIPYHKPQTGKMHRYFPDLWIKFTSGDIFIVEIKSSNETMKPRVNDKQYAKKLDTYLTNMAKWAAAKEFCRQKGVNFQILTEKVLG